MSRGDADLGEAGEKPAAGVEADEKRSQSIFSMMREAVDIVRAASERVRARAAEPGVSDENARRPEKADAQALSGQDASGQGVTVDSAGNRHTLTVFKDGEKLEKVDFKDKIEYEKVDGTKVEVTAGFSRYHRKDGSVEETYWGVRPEDNYKIGKEADGKVVLLSSTGRAGERMDDPAVAESRENLRKLAYEAIDRADRSGRFDDAGRHEYLSRLEADMARLEVRAAEHKLAASEVAKTYEEIARILKAGDNPAIGLTHEDRLRLARQVASQAATPTSVDQGNHDTCTVATVEVKTYSRTPSAAAKVVADIVNYGKYTAADGSEATAGVKPDKEARMEPLPVGARSHASQLFQVAAVNLYYAHHGLYQEGGIEDPQHPRDTVMYVQTEKGERLIDKRTFKEIMEPLDARVPMQSPRLPDNAIVEIGNRISGKNDTLVLEHTGSIYGGVVDGTHAGVFLFRNEREFGEQIAAAKREGRLPIILNVHKNQSIFWHDAGAPYPINPNAAHVVTITDYDEESGRVYVDNQWGFDYDHPRGLGERGVSVSEIYLATPEPADAVRRLEEKVKHDRSATRYDTASELELIRLKRALGMLGEDKYVSSLQEIMNTARMRWDGNRGTEDSLQYLERMQGEEKFYAMARNLPAKTMEANRNFLQRIIGKERTDEIISQKRLAQRGPVVTRTQR